MYIDNRIPGQLCWPEFKNTNLTKSKALKYARVEKTNNTALMTVLFPFKRGEGYRFWDMNS